MGFSVKSVNILGVTGSIGRSAADVILSAPQRFSVQTVTACNDAAGLADLAVRLGARCAVLASPDNFQVLKNCLADTKIKALCGEEALEEAAAEKVDLTLAAIVGMAGLKPVMQAVRSSKALALANKEPLVAAGPVIMRAIKDNNIQLLPVDSEHNAVFQVFDAQNRASVRKVILTASGGPFRTWSLQDMARATPEQAVAHPNWSMGRKISVDSATMMNKALEIIEAHYLFSLPPEQIEVLVHPQSVVHSMVEYEDGSILAQMGASDMHTPLSHVLAWPERMATPGRVLDLKQISQLNFEEPDTDKFPALNMAYECMEAGPYACVALNAANEIAVQNFLMGRIGFPDIMNCISHVLDLIVPCSLRSIEDIENFDQDTRRMAESYISKNKTTKRAAAR